VQQRQPAIRLFLSLDSATFLTNVPENSHTPAILALTPPAQDQMEIDHDSQYRVTHDYEDRE
jgi:hypothetical protein